VDERLQRARRAFSEDPTDPAARAALLRSLELSGQTEEAAEVVLSAGTTESVFEALAILANGGEREAAVRLFAWVAPRLASEYLLRGETDVIRARARRALVHQVYSARHKMIDHPEGREREWAIYGWVPSPRESPGPLARSVDECRSRTHCADLVRAALAGRDVPLSVKRRVYRQAIYYWTELADHPDLFENRPPPVPPLFQAMCLDTAHAEWDWVDSCKPPGASP
jgi:hypothetical protein